MCTVTFLPLANGDFIFTSSRDELKERETLAPACYREKGVHLLYPKDVRAGGTWIVVSEEKRLVCLLNGAFVKHVSTGNYAFSRGLVVKDILLSEHATTYIQEIDLKNVEPFTLIMLDWGKENVKIELVWDGFKKHIRTLDDTPRIWSSSTLYTDEMKKERQEWFQEWLRENEIESQEAILAFHNDDSKGTAETAINMKRSYIETVSITSVLRQADQLHMSYQDFSKAHVDRIDFNECIKGMPVES